MDKKLKTLRTFLPLLFIVLIIFSVSLRMGRKVDLTVPTAEEPNQSATPTSLSGSSSTTTVSENDNAPGIDTEMVNSHEEPMYSEVYQKRIDRVHQVCLEHNLTETSTSNKAFLISKKHGLCAKQVTKVGTTTTLGIFHILNEHEPEKIFNKSRMGVRGSKSSFKKTLDDEERKKYTLTFPSRNPYTRLYSAYIDKVYIFNSMGLVKSVLKHAGVKEEVSGLRKYEVTFQMFLDYALDPSSKHVLGSHYRVIFTANKWLCSQKHFFLIKQESFSADFENALKAVKVEDEKMEIIHKVLYSRRAEITIISILKIVMNRRKNIAKSIGKSKEDADMVRASVYLLTRLWKSFQIQGYIATKSIFPLEKFLSMSSVSDVNYVLSVFLEDIKLHPLTQSESKQQRQLAMLAAYDDIKDETVKKIQAIYKLDFEAFGYNSIGPE